MPSFRALVTHIISPGPVSKTTGTATAGSTTQLRDTAKNFTALGVAAGDVIHLVGGTGSGQASVVTAVSTTTNPNDTLTLSPALEVAVDNTSQYRAQAARQYTDISTKVLRVEFEDRLEDGIQTVRLPLWNGDGAVEGVFRERDPVELWIADDDSDSAAVTTSNDAHRCFVGRIDRIERATTPSGAPAVQLVVKDYAADTQDDRVFAVFLNRQLVTNSSTGVYDDLGDLFNANRGSMRDTAVGQPTFTFDQSAYGDLDTPPTGDVAYLGDSYYDAFNRLANEVQDSGLESLRFYVDSFTYFPRSGTPGNPTAYLHTREDAEGAALSWSITYGTNVIDMPKADRDARLTRNEVLLTGTRSDGVPVVVQKRQEASTGGAMGQDRFGRLRGVANVRGFYDHEAADAAASSALSKVKTPSERRTIRRTLVVERGRRLSGAVVDVTASPIGLSSATSLGIVGVKHVIGPREAYSEFELTTPRWGWNQILAPLQKDARSVLKEDVWETFQIYYAVRNGSGNADIYSVPVGEWGTSGAETLLFTVANPDAGTPANYILKSLSFNDGYLLICWEAAAVSGGGGKYVKGHIVNAYTGADVGGGFTQPFTLLADTDNAVFRDGILHREVASPEVAAAGFQIIIGYTTTAATTHVQERYFAKDGSSGAGGSIVRSTTMLFASTMSVQGDANGYRRIYGIATGLTNIKIGDFDGAATATDAHQMVIATAAGTVNHLRWDRRGTVFIYRDGALLAGVVRDENFTMQSAASGTRVLDGAAPYEIGLDLVPIARIYR